MEIDSERDCRIVGGMGGHTVFCSYRVCPELRLRNIPEMVAEDCVPLQKRSKPGSESYEC